MCVELVYYMPPMCKVYTMYVRKVGVYECVFFSYSGWCAVLRALCVLFMRQSEDVNDVNDSKHCLSVCVCV